MFVQMRRRGIEIRLNSSINTRRPATISSKWPVGTIPIKRERGPIRSRYVVVGACRVISDGVLWGAFSGNRMSHGSAENGTGLRG